MTRRGVLSATERLEMLDEQEDITHVDLKQPDYTWTWRIPLDVLRRLIERESAEAIRLANQSRLRT